MTPLIIGLSGPAGGGKDEAADLIIKALEDSGMPSLKIAFATALKDVCQRVFGCSEEDLYTQEGKKKVSEMFPELTHRHILQATGTECFREVFGDEIWVKVLERDAAKSMYRVVIVPDVRTEQEAAFAKTNGLLIDIDACFPEFEKVSGKEGSHSSESGYETVPDVKIVNGTTLKDFQDKVTFLANGVIVPLALTCIFESHNVCREIFRKSVSETMNVLLSSEEMPADLKISDIEKK